MLDLALHGQDEPVSLAEISARQGISQSYLEQLFSRLRRNRLVISVRGPGGGYRLERDSENIDVADIIVAVNESLDTTRCGGSGNCQDGDVCLTHGLWEDLTSQILDYLHGISLADIVARQDIRTIARRQDEKLRRDALRISIGEPASGQL